MNNWSTPGDASLSIDEAIETRSGPSAIDVRRSAMDLLARREHGRAELILKLTKRYSSVPEIIEAQVDRLRQEGLQSDSRLAEAFIRARANRGQGPIKIKAELRRKGVDDSVISSAFETSEYDWFALVSDVASRRFGDTPPADAKERARRGRFLLQRGFSTDHIRSL